MSKSSKVDLSLQRREVGAWLEELFDGNDVPDYELNARTISYLHELCQTSQVNDKYAQLVAEDLEQKTKEYYSEAQRLEAVLNRLSLGPKSMSQSGMNCVRNLARLGMLLDVRDISDTCYCLALQALDDEIEDIENQKKEEEEKLSILCERAEPARLKCQSLQKALEIVKVKGNHSQERREEEKRAESSVFYHNKSKGYAKEIKKLQEQLAHTQIDDSLYHEALVKKAEHLENLNEKLAPLTAELQSYSSLPPDLTEAKIKIEQEKRELEKLKKQLSECIATNVM